MDFSGLHIWWWELLMKLFKVLLRFKKRSIITSLMDCYDMHRLMTMPKVFCSPSKARVIWKNHVMHSRNKFVLCWSNIIFILLLSTEPKPTVSNHFRKFICWSCCIQIIKAGNYWKRSFIVLVSVITCTGPCTQLFWWKKNWACISLIRSSQVLISQPTHIAACYAPWMLGATCLVHSSCTKLEHLLFFIVPP